MPHLRRPIIIDNATFYQPFGKKKTIAAKSDFSASQMLTGAIVTGETRQP